MLSTVPQLLLAIWLAHLLNRRLRAQTLFRIALLLPNVTSVVAVVVIFSQLFGRDFGLINWMLSLVGVGQIDWAGRAPRPRTSRISVMIMWRWTGYNALIFLAAMQAVPRELYEAATLDGASSVTQLRRITIPMIRPTIIFAVIVSTIGAHADHRRAAAVRHEQRRRRRPGHRRPRPAVPDPGAVRLRAGVRPRSTSATPRRRRG